MLLLTTSWSGLNASIVLVVARFKTRSSCALLMFNVIDLPVIAHVPRIVPVTPWPSVLLMNPRGRTSDTNLPSAVNVIVSFASPTVPCQPPMILAGYSASATGATSGEHDESPHASKSPNKNKRIILAISPNREFPNRLRTCPP